MGQDHPDSKLFPHATGAAALMVKEHEKEDPLKLYSGWFCPFVQRVLLVLLEKNIPFQYIEVNPYQKPESLLKLNPRGLVPTLEYNNKPLYESTVICEFLEEAYPSATPHLLPSDPYAKAQTRIWVDFVTSRIIPAFHRFLQHQAGSSISIETVRNDFLDKLKQFTDAMDPAGPYFFGKEVSLIDLILAPWAVRLWVFEHFKGGLDIPNENVWSRWARWQSAIEQRDSVIKTTSKKEHYLPIYQRYADDTAQSELAKATREGRGVP
ncbi:glutathione transferase omega-1 [Diplocarpon rosae]|nr:glutathione transferase omega-1 [Diplocarpon rosae]